MRARSGVLLGTEVGVGKFQASNLRSSAMDMVEGVGEAVGVAGADVEDISSEVMIDEGKRG